MATSGLAILAADSGCPALAVVLLALAICVYALMTGLVVWRACHDPSAIALKQPDIWILMGGAAIATLAGDHIHKAGVEAVRPVTVATWIVATLWLPLLVVASVRLRDGNWWAAVFPLGMYSSATYATAVETGWALLTTISLVFFWLALVAWVLTCCDFGVNALAVGSVGFVAGLVVAGGVGGEFTDQGGAAEDGDVITIADAVALVAGPAQSDVDFVGRDEQVARLLADGVAADEHRFGQRATGGTGRLGSGERFSWSGPA